MTPRQVNVTITNDAGWFRVEPHWTPQEAAALLLLEREKLKRFQAKPVRGVSENLVRAVEGNIAELEKVARSNMALAEKEENRE